MRSTDSEPWVTDGPVSSFRQGYAVGRECDRMATVLVAYGSKHGATAEIAQWLGQALERTGSVATVRPVDEIATLDGFDAVVVGGPIYAGHLIRSVPAFFKRHRDALSRQPVALFIAGSSLGIGSTPEGEEKARGIAEASRNGIDIVALGLFGGRFQMRDVPLIGRFLKSDDDRDTRDRAAIEAWAEALPARFGL